MRKDKLKNLAAFRQLIVERIEKEPLKFDGQLWAALPQEKWSKLLDLDVRTIRRLAEEPGIVSTGAKCPSSEHSAQLAA